MSAGLIETRREDGALVLRAPVALSDDRPDILDRLAAVDPQRVLMTAPGREGRDSITYGAARTEARQLRDWLVAAHDLRPGARVATLLPAGIAALRLRLACLCGGFVHVALPPFPFRDPRGEEAMRLLAIAQPDLIVAPAGHPAGGLALPDPVPPAPARADHPAQPGDWTAIFFTAGSTGAAKGVAVTRGQISACQAAAVALWPFLAEGPVLIDWMPWNHVFGGLDNLFKVIWNGGTLHLDRPPSEHTIGATLDLMEAVRPTLYIGVPLGMKLLLAALEAAPERQPRALARLRHVFLAGAAIEPALWDRLAAFARRSAPPIALLSGYGATETGSTMCLSPGGVDRPGLLGWPLPGHEVALCPVEDRTEIRFRGPVLGPAYLTEAGETPLPLDAFGFYRTGDAGFLDRETGCLRFDGRLSEDFKLASGIKVRTGALRSQIIRACAPDLEDMVLGGAGREALSAVLFAAPGAGRDRVRAALAQWNRENPASSTRIAAIDWAEAPPEVARGEVSAKGQIVQSRFLRNHAALFDALAEGTRGEPLPPAQG